MGSERLGATGWVTAWFAPLTGPTSRATTATRSSVDRLFTLSLGAIASPDRPTVLPQRTLLRHLTWILPSGQSVAVAIGIEPIAARPSSRTPMRSDV